LIGAQFDCFAASSFQVAHQVHACSRPFLFFFEVFLKSCFFDAVVVFGDEGVPFSLVFRVFARQVVAAQEAAFKLFCGCAFSVFARCSSSVQAHWALRVGEPFEAFPEFFKPEGFDHVPDPVVASGVDESFQLARDRLHSSVPGRTLATVDAAYSMLSIPVFHNRPSMASKRRTDADKRSVDAGSARHPLCSKPARSGPSSLELASLLARFCRSEKPFVSQGWARLDSARATSASRV